MKNDYDRQILSYLNDHEMLTTEAAMEFLPLSEVSVRRIFNRLAELNLVRREAAPTSFSPEEASICTATSSPVPRRNAVSRATAPTLRSFPPVRLTTAGSSMWIPPPQA